MPFAHAYFVQYTTKIQNKTHHLTTKFTLLSRRTNSVLWAQNMISFYWAEQNEFQHDPVICRRNAHGCFATRNASGIRSLIFFTKKKTLWFGRRIVEYTQTTSLSISFCPASHKQSKELSSASSSSQQPDSSTHFFILCGLSMYAIFVTNESYESSYQFAPSLQRSYTPEILACSCHHRLSLTNLS